jgi:type I restriction enzyme R subunit
MRIDREGFRRAVEEDVLANEILSALWKNGDIIEAEEYTKKSIFNKPTHFLNLEKIRKVFNVDRRISIREFLQIAFGEKDTFESKSELLDAEWDKFVELYPVDTEHYYYAKDFFKSYILDAEIRDIIDRKAYGELFHSPALSFETWNSCNGYKDAIPRYIKDYVPLNMFMN